MGRLFRQAVVGVWRWSQVAAGVRRWSCRCSAIVTKIEEMSQFPNGGIRAQPYCFISITLYVTCMSLGQRVTYKRFGSACYPYQFGSASYLHTFGSSCYLYKFGLRQQTERTVISAVVWSFFHIIRSLDNYRLLLTLHGSWNSEGVCPREFIQSGESAWD